MSPSRDRTGSEPALVLRGVSKSFRAGVPGCLAVRRVLGPVDLVVRRGERIGVFGPQGSGKSTLLLIAAGALRPDAGDVRSAVGATIARRGAHRVDGVRGVAESLVTPERDAIEFLTWEGDGGRTLIVVARTADGLPRFVDRMLHLAHGQLLPCAVPVPRVDSPYGAP